MPAELESATAVDSAGNTVTAASATAMSGGKLETLCVAIVDPISTGACLAFEQLRLHGPHRVCQGSASALELAARVLHAS